METVLERYICDTITLVFVFPTDQYSKFYTYSVHIRVIPIFQKLIYIKNPKFNPLLPKSNYVNLRPD